MSGVFCCVIKSRNRKLASGKGIKGKSYHFSPKIKDSDKALSNVGIFAFLSQMN